MKQVFGASQQRSAAVPIIAGISALGAGIYYTTRGKPKVSDEQARRDRAQAKLDEGLGGAGVGGNAVTGGHELSHVDAERKKETSNAPLDKLPSGGVGGGVGGGGANVRAIEMTERQRPGTSSSTATANASSVLGGIFGTGGPTAGTGTDDETKHTRAASSHDGTPTRRDATHHEHNQPRVPKSGDKGGSQGGDQSSSNSSSGLSLSQSLQGAFGQGGGKVAEPGEQSSGFRNPKIASNHADTPTKRAA
ncbi:hypothetical protein ACJ41O_014068 [Fusarium nematophilum]